MVRGFALTLCALAALAAPVAAPLAAEDAVDGWPRLETAVIAEHETPTDWQAAKHFPEALAELEGRLVRLAGIVVPQQIEPGPGRHLILMRTAHEDPFHGDPTRVVEITLEAPVMLPAGAAMHFVGRLELVRDPGTLQLFRLQGARLAEVPATI